MRFIKEYFGYFNDLIFPSNQNIPNIVGPEFNKNQISEGQIRDYLVRLQKSKNQS